MYIVTNEFNLKFNKKSLLTNRRRKSRDPMDDDCQELTKENQHSQPTTTTTTDDDDDPLIAEVDIYLTRLFADQLYLFQYPLRPSQLPYENNQTFVGARLKPKNKLVQLDQKLDSESAFHCRDHEATIAENWSSAEPSDRAAAVEQLTFSSTNTTPANNYKRFAVGAITPNGIQLSPLNAIFQLRPDFDVTSTNLSKAMPTSDEEDEIDNPTHPLLNKQTSSATDDSATEEDSSFKLVTMRFWRPEGRLERERKLRSYNYVERARQEERWIDLAYFSPGEPEAIELRQRWTMLDQIDVNRLMIRWRNTISFRDYFQLLLCNEQLCLNDKETTHPLEANPSTEQKPAIPLLPSKSKKNPKTKSDKAAKKLSKKSRNNTSRVSTSSAATTSTDQKPATTTGSTPLSSVSVPQTIVKQDPETIQNELISFMRRRFGYRPYFKLSEINIAIKLELISSAPGHPLASGVTEASILRAATEIGAIHVNRKWPKNLKQEPVFVNAQMGDKYDVLRRYVAELLDKSDSFQFTDLRSRIRQENQTQQFPVHEVKKFVKDHCITRSSRRGVLYCVKGTVVK